MSQGPKHPGTDQGTALEDLAQVYLERHAHELQVTEVHQRSQRPRLGRRPASDLEMTFVGTDALEKTRTKDTQVDGDPRVRRATITRVSESRTVLGAGPYKQGAHPAGTYEIAPGVELDELAVTRMHARRPTMQGLPLIPDVAAEVQRQVFEQRQAQLRSEQEHVQSMHQAARRIERVAELSQVVETAGRPKAPAPSLDAATRQLAKVADPLDRIRKDFELAHGRALVADTKK